jgi:hypothetical protein
VSFLEQSVAFGTGKGVEAEEGSVVGFDCEWAPGVGAAVVRGAGDDLRLRAWAVHRTLHRLHPHTLLSPRSGSGSRTREELGWGVAGGAVHPEVASELPLVLERAPMAWGDKLTDKMSTMRWSRPEASSLIQIRAEM